MNTLPPLPVARISKKHQLPSTTGNRVDRGWEGEIDRQREEAENSRLGLSHDGTGLLGSDPSGVLGPQPPVMGAVEFGPPTESLVVTYPVWVHNFPHGGLIVNPRCWVRGAFKDKGWWEDVLRAEWKDSGDFILRFDSDATGREMMRKLVQLLDPYDPKHEKTLAPHWATPGELFETLSHSVPVEIQAMFERTKGGSSNTTTGLQNADVPNSSSSGSVAVNSTVASRPTQAKVVGSGGPGSGSVGSRGDVRAPTVPKKPRVDDSPEVRSIGSDSPVKKSVRSRMLAAKPATESNPVPRDCSRQSGGLSAPAASAFLPKAPPTLLPKVAPVVLAPVVIKSQDGSSLGKALDRACVQPALQPRGAKPALPSASKPLCTKDVSKRTVIVDDDEQEVLEDYRVLGQTAKRQHQLMDRNLAVLIWRSGLPSFMKNKRVPLTDAWCKGWGLPSLAELWNMPAGVTPWGLGKPEPHQIWLAPRSVGDVLDKHRVDGTSASAFSVGVAGSGAGQPRTGTCATGLGSGSGGSGSGIGSSGGSLTTQMPPSRSGGLAAGTNLEVTAPGNSTTASAGAPTIRDLLGDVPALDD